MFLLDTNVLIWWATDDTRLSRQALSRVEGTRARRLATSVLNVWELGVAVARGRVRTRLSFAEIRRRFLERGVAEQEVTAPVVLDALGLDNLPGDPVDRLIVATARTLELTLITSDEKILNWPGELERMDARR